MRAFIAALCTLALLAALPAASAHTTDDTADGEYLITVGNKNEPVYTFVPTGLDLLIRENNTDRTPVLDAHLQDLTATLVAPDGSTMSQAIEAQFGDPGRYSFSEGYTLTMPGEYYLEIEGDLFGSAVDNRILVGSGPLTDQGDNYFPHEDVSSLLDLAAAIDALEARVAELEEHSDEHTSNNGAPGLGIFTVGLAMAGAALVYNRRD